MDLRIQTQGQLNIEVPANLKNASTQSVSGSSSSDKSMLQALSTDTASISSITAQLSGDVSIRQDRVDALRSQIETGTYTVDSRAVATAMFQNLFRS